MFRHRPQHTENRMSYLPCVGCGWCCLHDQCTDSMRRHGYLPRCPELFWSDEAGRYLCLTMLEGESGDGIRRDQHTGGGCCAPLNSWRQDIRNRDK